MTDQVDTGAVKAGAEPGGRPSMLRSLNDRKVLQALTSLKNRGEAGVPKLKRIAEEVSALGFEPMDETAISRSITSLENKKYIRRDLTVLAQEGGLPA